MARAVSDKDKRQDLRVSISTPLAIKFRLLKGRGLSKFTRKKSAVTQNISANGLLVELPLHQEQIDKIVRGEDKLILELKVPHLHKPLIVSGKIIWWEKRDKRGKTVFLTGISFEEIREKEREKLLPLLLNLCLKGKASL